LIFCLSTAAIASKLELWQWRVEFPHFFEIKSLARLLLWFTWPAWPLALWTLWRWRYQLQNISANPHLSLPLWFLGVAIASTWFSGISDRALLLALPALATLAAFALPTFKRSMSAFIDWFTLLFFSFGALIVWTVWLSLQTGFPAQPAINVGRLAPGFVAQFSLTTFVIAGLATLGWAGLHQVRSMMGDTECVHYYGLTKAQGAAFEFHGNFKLHPVVRPSNQLSTDSKQCAWLIVDTQALASLSQEVNVGLWTRHATVRRPSDNNEDIVLFRAVAPTTSAKP
jgi:hypothetical protein